MQRDVGEGKRTKTGFRLFLGAWLVMGLVLASPRTSAAGPAEFPSLSEIVLFGMRPATELDLSNYREEGRPCVKAYLDAITPSSDLRHWNMPSDPEETVDARRDNLEEQMITLLGEKVRRDAATFALAVPLFAEWEGTSTGPADEANFAEQWLSKNPDTPIAAFLHLFMAHRLRAGYEAARMGREEGLWPILARRYREAIGKARSPVNPLVSCIASDMEAQAHVYLEGQGRP